MDLEIKSLHPDITGPTWHHSTPTEAHLLSVPEQDLLAQHARESLYEFGRQAWHLVESAEFIHGDHIEALARHLEAVTRGDIPQMVINIPPGSGKSLWCSVFWPCWEWVRNPTIRWIFISYDQRLSTRDSVKCRNILESPWFLERWGDKVQLKGDANQKTYYETSAGGYRMATSITGHGIGEHMDRLVYDDPNDVGVSSGGAIASGAADREAVIELHTQKMGVRGVARQARRVLIQQRLHVRDLTGWILENEPND